MAESEAQQVLCVFALFFCIPQPTGKVFFFFYFFFFLVRRRLLLLLLLSRSQGRCVTRVFIAMGMLGMVR